MKKILFAISTAALLASNVGAVLVTVDRVPGYYVGSGGEFNISPVLIGGYAASALAVNRYGNVGFESFCIEFNEHVSIPGTYQAVVNPAGAIAGGVSGGNPDPISLGTAWLYYRFATGSLGGYNYTPGVGREISAGMLQNALWYLEGEISLASAGGVGLGGNDFLNAVVTQFGSLGSAAADNNGTYLVSALNLYSFNSATGQWENAQDQLILVPDGGSVLLLLGFGLSAIGLYARKVRA